MFSPDLIRRIDLALSCKDTFALVLMPGSDEPLWFEAGNNTADATLDIVPWLGRYAHRTVIGNAAAGPSSSPMRVEEHSTRRADYISSVSKVIESCRRREGKTVYSRVICGETDAGHSWGHTADRLFSRFPDTFRYILYTPATQGWMGATPETLADYSAATATMRTVALAGTRPRPAVATPWDDKNLRENLFVSDYILSALRSLGLEPRVDTVGNVGYGAIEHLCAHISCQAPAAMLPQIIDALNPTPALCGYPLGDAVSDIALYERHRRHLYGGYIAVRDSKGYHAYVNLRCVHFDSRRFCIYGGGGIVSASVPAEEYAETEAKTSFLRQLLVRESVVNLETDLPPHSMHSYN